jgi:AraC-like DNA-binding protein
LRLAARHLGAGKAISEVAALVGFAQASTFHRAFKSWTGETPAEYQERHGPRPAPNRPSVI